MRERDGVRALLLAASLGLAMAVGAAEPAKSVGGWSPESLDASVNPCDDFFQYACGGWIKANPIPADQARWGTFNALADRNRDTLKAILDAASPDDPKRTPAQQQIGDFYATCMDEPAIEKAGAAAVKPELDRLAAVKAKADLPAVVAQLHAAGTGRLLRLRLRAGFQGRDPRDRHHRPGGPRPARSRLLLQRRREIEGAAQEVRWPT